MPEQTRPVDARQCQIDAAAQAWVVRLTSGHVQPDDVAAARAWCQVHPDHQQAFVAARHLWQLSGHLSEPAVPQRRARPWRWATAAVLVLGLGLLLAHQQAWDADYRTAQGAQWRIDLADGSHVVLDSNSAVDVQLSAGRRDIVLRRGTALFEVAHDPQRPFRVRAGDLEAVALGTVYAVSHEPAGITVTVAEGRVGVKGLTRDVVVQAGEQVSLHGTQLDQPTPVDTSRALAWQHGRLVFELTPLAEVLAQLQRYRPGYLLIGDERLRTLKVSGTFQLDRLDEGLATLEQAFALKVERYTDYLLVLHSRD